MQTKEESLVIKSARRCIQLLNGSNFKAWVQFWQTWANMEAIPFIVTSNYFPKDIKEEAQRRGGVDWINFALSPSGVPSVFKSISGFFSNSNFWDPKNKVIIWDDRLWLGNSYLFLYMVFRDEKYLQVGMELYSFILKCNADWRAENYRGLEWKPGTDYRNSITNQLFMVFCGRLYQITRDSHYLDGLKAQYRLLFGQPQKYINNNQMNVFPDAVGPDGFYTYNQGVALEGLTYLVLYGDNYQEYMGELVRLTQGMIEYFRNKDQAKLIMKEYTTGDRQNKRTSSIFRSFVFRHLLHSFRLLPPQAFNDFKNRVPFLRTFILDNAQAMSKYQNLTPCYNWEKFNDGVVHDYNAFNQFYVMLCAVEIFSINEIVVDGLMIPSDGTLEVQTGENIRGLYISTFYYDAQGVYRRGERRLVKTGRMEFKELLLGQALISRENNRNVLEITLITIHNYEIPMTLVHIEGEGTLFGLIPDMSGEVIINNYTVRIKAPRMREGIEYSGSQGLYVASLSVPTLNNLAPLVINVT